MTTALRAGRRQRDDASVYLTDEEWRVARTRLEQEGCPLDQLLNLCWEVEDAGHVRGAMALSMAGAALAGAKGDADTTVDLRANALRLLHAQDHRAAVEYGQDSLGWVRRATLVLPKVRLLSSLGVAYADLGRIDRALESLRQAQALPLNTSPEAAYLLAVKGAEAIQMLGLLGEAAAEWRKVLALLERLPGGAADAFRQVYVRVAYSNALLLAHVQEGQDIDLRKVDTVLSTASRYVPAVPVLKVQHLAVSGLASAVRGDGDTRWSDAFGELSAEVVMREGGLSQPAVCAWAILEASRGGRLHVARGLLAKIDPANAADERPAWAPAWHRAMAEVQAAAGQHAEAVASYRAFAEADKVNRTRNARLAFEMAGRASEAGEIRLREREASTRAHRLARHNTALVAEKEKLAESALKDALTGLGNRRLLELRVAALQGRKRAANCTVVIGDIDHFKSINDRFSHQVGDRVLAAVGALLAQTARKNDCAVRWGGEEFVVLFGNPVDPKRIEAVRHAIETWDWSAVVPGLAVTISFGAAAWTTSAAFDDALALADRSLYAAKRAGRNRVVFA